MTVDFVSKRGGGLLVFGAQAFVGRGLASTPIETILPLYLAGRTTTIAQGAVREPNTVSLTAAGANHGLMRLGMTADINQTIYGSTLAWKKISEALDFRGRSKILSTSFSQRK